MSWTDEQLDLLASTGEFVRRDAEPHLRKWEEALIARQVVQHQVVECAGWVDTSRVHTRHVAGRQVRGKT